MAKQKTFTLDNEFLLRLIENKLYPDDFIKTISVALFEKNISLKELLPEGFAPREVLRLIYKTAKTFYDGGNYTAALSLFHPLVAYDQHNYHYIIGSAACLQMLGNYKAALQGYTLAYAAWPSNPIPLFYIAECAEKLGRKKGASLLYGQAIAIAGSRQEYRSLKEQAELIRNRLRSKSK